MRFLVTFRLKQPIVAMVPAILPWYVAPCAWQASSMTIRPYFSASAMDWLHVGRQPMDVDRHQHLGPVADLGLDLRRVDVVGARVDVDENRDGVLLQDGMKAARKGKGAGDDLVARTHACRK